MRLLSIALLFSTLGCVSARQAHWEDVVPGQSREDVLALMGNPDAFEKSKKDDLDVYYWGMNNYTRCGVRIDKRGYVDKKGCQVDPQAQAQDFAQRQAAMQIYLQMQSQQQQSQRVYNPPPARAPTSTTCTSTPSYYGGSVQTNCTSQPSGADIYR